MYYQSRGVILKQRDFKDSDKLLSIFTEKEGKVSAIAKGIKKPKSSLRAVVQPFCHSYLYLHRSHDLALLTQGKLLDFYGNSRQDLERALNCLYMMELLDKTLLDHVPLPALYACLLQVLEGINEQGLNPLFIRYFEGQLLANLGYKPALKYCAGCGQSLSGEFNFSVAQGGLLCLACKQATDEYTLNLGGETVGLLRLVTEGSFPALSKVKASPTALKQLEVLLEKYLEYHLERRFKMKNTISVLKRTMI